MEVEFDKVRWALDGDGFWLSLRVRSPMAVRRMVDPLSEKPHIAHFTPKRKRRSLDANAYAWVLLDKLSVVLSREGTPVSPEDVYRQLVPHVGGNSRILPIRDDAVEEWKRIWSAGRTGWICEDLGECRNLEGYRNIRCYYGSSVYDADQMARLIQLIVQECRQLDIETATPEELAALQARWENAPADKSAGHIQGG